MTDYSIRTDIIHPKTLPQCTLNMHCETYKENTINPYECWFFFRAGKKPLQRNICTLCIRWKCRCDLIWPVCPVQGLFDRTERCPVYIDGGLFYVLVSPQRPGHASSSFLHGPPRRVWRMVISPCDLTTPYTPYYNTPPQPHAEPKQTAMGCQGW